MQFFTNLSITGIHVALFSTISVIFVFKISKSMIPPELPNFWFFRMQSDLQQILSFLSVTEAHSLLHVLKNWLPPMSGWEMQHEERDIFVYSRHLEQPGILEIKSGKIKKRINKCLKMFPRQDLLEYSSLNESPSCKNVKYQIKIINLMIAADDTRWVKLFIGSSLYRT